MNDDRDMEQTPHRDPLTGKMDTGREEPGADAGTGAGDQASAPGADATSGGWQGGDAGLQADEGLIGRGGTGSLGSGGVATPQSDPSETSWQDEAGGMTGGAQGQGGMGDESWEGRGRDTGEGGFTTGDAGFGSNTADDGGPQRDDVSSDRTDLS